MTESLDPLSPGRRIDALDAVRGLALAGILLTNIPQLTDMTRVVVPGELLPIPAALEFVAHQRFFPIFAFLFGISFALFLDGAATRSARPRLVLLRRLLVLAGIGLLHHMAQPGEALLPYAVVGIGVLLPASLLPRLVVLVAGLALLIVALTWLSGGLGLVPGLFLLGLAVARYGVAATLDRRPRQIAVLFGVSAVVAAVTLPLQAASLQYSGFDTTSAVAGLAVAGCYTGGLLLLLRTPARRVLAAVLNPLGRTALTNYVASTLIVLAVAPVLGLHDSPRWGTMLGLAAAILVVQILISRWWLRRFRYGPLEWAWRCLTWCRIVPIRRDAQERRRDALAAAALAPTALPTTERRGSGLE